jgi:putative transposase
MRKKFEPLTDSQWQVIAEFLPLQRKRKIDLRKVVDGIRWINETGSQWRNLPGCFPDWSAVYYYFRKWGRDGTLQKMNIGLNALFRAAFKREDRPSLVCIDSQSVKLAPFVCEERGVDGNKKINGRKRQVLVDTLGLVWGVVVHAANGSDSIYGGVVVLEIKSVLQRVKKVLVDRGYEGEFFEVTEGAIGVIPEVSSKPPTARGFVPVKWRWVSERTFGWFNFFRRLSKDYEKTVQSSESWMFWANCQMILAKL